MPWPLRQALEGAVVTQLLQHCLQLVHICSCHQTLYKASLGMVPAKRQASRRPSLKEG